VKETREYKIIGTEGGECVGTIIRAEGEEYKRGAEHTGRESGEGSARGKKPIFEELRERPKG
jgi:hypothetical protein